MNGKFYLNDKPNANFCKKFFASRKPPMTILAHLHTADNLPIDAPCQHKKPGSSRKEEKTQIPESNSKDCKDGNSIHGKSNCIPEKVNQPPLMRQRSSWSLPERKTEETSTFSSVPEDAEIKSTNDPAIPTPPFPQDKSQPYPFDVKHDVKTPVKTWPAADVSSEKSRDIPIEKTPPKEIATIKQALPPKVAQPTRKSYITSVDTWQPASVRIICSKCNKRSRPLLRTYTRRVSENLLDFHF